MLGLKLDSVLLGVFHKAQKSSYSKHSVSSPPELQPSLIFWSDSDQLNEHELQQLKYSTIQTEKRNKRPFISRCNCDVTLWSFSPKLVPGICSQINQISQPSGIWLDRWTDLERTPRRRRAATRAASEDKQSELRLWNVVFSEDGFVSQPRKVLASV